MKKRRGVLSAEDRELWDRIRNSVTPLKGRKTLEEWLEEEALPPAPTPAAEVATPGPANLPPKPAFLPPYRPPMSSPTVVTAGIDEHTAKRIRRGRTGIDARIDLHGMTQHEAHRALYRFLEDAQARDCRIVLVITGKGRTGDGVLRRTVPMWLAEPLFHRLVGGWREAHVTHGGEGAIYVRLRRHDRRGGAA